MNTTEFLSKLQRYVVNSGIDISVLRLRPPGTVEATHKFLYAVDLSEFANPKSFRTVLDEKTEALMRSFGGQTWGHARKCLNIFLRKAAYDYYLRQRHALGSLEPVLELPLDSNVAAGIAHDAKKFGLSRPPKWDTIKRLTPRQNDSWQRTAAEIARIKKIDRIHLDLWYWRSP